MSELIVLDNIEYKLCPQFTLYAVSRCGKVIRASTKRLMTQRPHGVPEYLVVRTCTDSTPKNTKVHRMVAFTWLPEPSLEDQVQVNHKDGNKFNNHVDNLEWVTRSRNQRHAIEEGLKGKGEELYNSEFTNDQVHDICKHLVDGWLVKDIADKFSASKDLVRKIKAGDTYFHIRQLYEIPHTYIHDFSESTVRWVCERITEQWSDKKIAENSTNQNLTIIAVKRIRYKIRYKYISDEYF